LDTLALTLVLNFIASRKHPAVFSNADKSSYHRDIQSKIGPPHGNTCSLAKNASYALTRWFLDREVVAMDSIRAARVDHSWYHDSTSWGLILLAVDQHSP